ncbi:MAG: DegT/DnrJ/EryC1/StrS family aminotransferase [Acidimicrobiia bacterium]|nr:DegT/DnrJ/EryC1/StrS family aminotransferase [Acidimicrobiia bacterium]
MSGLRDEIHSAVLSVIDSGWWLNGNETRLLQEEFASYCGTTRAIAVANGTDALELALRSAETESREVINTANAGGYATTACRIVGAIPVYVDVTERAVIDIDRCIEALRPVTAAIVATHLYGNTVDIPQLLQRLAAAGREDVVVIEDCSQAHGANINGRRVGSMGHIGVFSFYPTKNLGALGDAGALTTNSETLAETLLRLRQYGWETRYNSTQNYGRNSRMDEIQAAGLRIKLPHLDTWNQERRSIVGRFQQSIDASTTTMVTDTDEGVAHLAVVATEDRPALVEILDATGIGHDVHFPTLDPDQPSQQGLPTRVEDLTMSRSLQERILTIPCFPGMTEDEISRVESALATGQ